MMNHCLQKDMLLRVPLEGSPKENKSVISKIMENFTAQTERHPWIHIRKWKKMFYVTPLRVCQGGSPKENESVVSKITENFTAQSERHPLIHIRKRKKMFCITPLSVHRGGSPMENESVISKITENFTALMERHPSIMTSCKSQHGAMSSNLKVLHQLEHE